MADIDITEIRAFEPRCLDCGETISRRRLADTLESLNPGFVDRVSGRGAIDSRKRSEGCR